MWKFSLSLTGILVFALFLVSKSDIVPKKFGNDFQALGTTPIGEPCSVDEDCKYYPESAECNSVVKVCSCKDEFETIGPIDDEYQCGPVSKQIGDSCYISAQCKNGVTGGLSDCMPSFDDSSKLVCNCTAEATHEPGQHVCHPIKELVGDDCEVNAQCSVNLGELSECDAKKCKCSSGAVASYDLDECLPIHDKLGSECSISEQCTMGNPGVNSDCLEVEDSDPPQKVCSCKDDSINEPGEHICYLRRTHVGESCDVHAQCNVNLGELSECYGDKCSCLDDISIPNVLETFCLAIVDIIENDCEEPQQCTEGEPGEHSDCLPAFDDATRLVCNCTDDAIFQPGKHKCHLKAVELGDACEEQAQCTANLGELSNCVADACACNTGAIPSADNLRCLAIRDELGLECSESSQCKQGFPGEYSDCLDGTCKCTSGATSEPGHHVCKKRAEFVGDGCEFNEQCKANLGDLSECQGGAICVCTPNYGIPNKDNDFCLAIINTIGGPCEEPQQCQKGVPGDYSTCSESSVIPGSKVCNCSVGAAHEPGRHKCHKSAVAIGETCEIDAQCQVNLGEFTECTLTNGCQCIEGSSIPNKDSNKCLPIIDKIGGACEEDTQCTTGSPGEWSECRRADDFPYDNVCACQSEAVKHPTLEVCFEKAEAVGDACAIHEQCTANIGVNAECNSEGICACKSGTVPNLEGDAPGTSCIPGGILIGKPCFDMAQCSGDPGTSSICTTSGVCGCLQGYTESIKLDDCLTIKNQIGDECKERQQCQQGTPGRLSDCIIAEGSDKGSCDCTSDAINEAGQHRCYLKAVHVGDACTVRIQCVANLEFSQCLDGVCECLQGTIPSSDRQKCVDIRYLNDPCTDDNQCNHVEHAVCLNNDTQASFCQCGPGFFPHPSTPNKCIQMASFIGDSCADDPALQCDNLGNAKCNEQTKTCSCDSQTKVVSENRKACLVIVSELHKDCKETIQCQVPDSVCLAASGNSAKCICPPDDYVESVESPNKKCLKIQTEMGQPCNENIQCTTGIEDDNVECGDGVCRCANPYEFYVDTCYISAGLGHSCKVDQECRLGVNNLTVCSNPGRTCVCMDSAVEVDDSCWVVKAVGDQCVDDAECLMSIIGPVVCSESNVCTCEDGYSPDTGGRRCSFASSIHFHSITLLYIIITSLSLRLF